MGFRPEPILDVARGLSGFTAAFILSNQILVVMREMFTDRCGHCKGAGRLICPHCGGTKTMRNRPGEFHAAQADVVERNPFDVSQCIHCGPLLVYDLVQEARDDEDTAFEIMDNMKDAYAGKVRTHRMPITAGTVPCPKCWNQPKVRRHTPNFARIFKLENPWWWEISAKAGAFRGWSPVRRHHYVEFPSRKPHVDDLDPDYIARSMKADFEAEKEEWEEEENPPYWEEDVKEEELGRPEEGAEEMELENRPKIPTTGDTMSGRAQLERFELPVVKYVDDSDSEIEE